MPANTRAPYPDVLPGAPTSASALVFGDNDWGALALDAVLAAGGWGSRHVSCADAASVLLATDEPAVAFFLVRLDGTSHARAAIDLCSNLRARGLLPAPVPAVFVTFDAPRRDDLMRSYAAGAWEVCQLPVDGPLLLARLDRWLGAYRAAAHARQGRLLDDETGLYTARGLLHRSAELAAVSLRTADPLACLALALDAPPTSGCATPGSASRDSGRPRAFNGEGATVPVRDRDWLLARLVARVRAHGGRGSDVYGQTGREEFAVLAPATSEAEALRMADRLSVLLRDQWEQVVAAYRATRPDGASPLGSDALNAPPSPRWAVAVLGDDTTPQGAAARLLTQASRGLLHPAAARGRAAEH